MTMWPAFSLLALVGALTAVQTQPPAAPSTPPPLAAGAALYKQHCARCHGPDGRGGGPDAARMHFLPGDLTTMTAENHGVFPSERTKQIIQGVGPAAHGDRLMPVWGDVFTRTSGGREHAQERVDALARFLESIQRRSTE